MKTKKTYLCGALIFLLLAPLAFADGISVQLKRTNPGIASAKSAELIFDVVNTDLRTELEGFLYCKSPDDVIIGSSLGVGSGSGVQYVSPKFTMNQGPSQKAISIVLDSEIAGDMRTGCVLKYIPFTTETSQTQIANNQTNQTEVQATNLRHYLKMNGEGITDPRDQDYRELRLDKTVPFIENRPATDVACPQGQTSCKAEEVQTEPTQKTLLYGMIGAIVLLAGAVIYLFGRLRGN